ncbi:MAG: class I SAM-dependent methyltransferase [Candidatus Heimdallarchaeota archaeon]
MVPPTKHPTQQIGKVYDQIAESFDSKRKYPWKEVVQYIETIPQDNLVLDLGCGNGRHSNNLMVQGSRVVSMDISFKILQIALQNELENFRYSITGIINADGQTIPFKRLTFDNIVSIAVIHHLDSNEKRKTFLKEMYRILASNGSAFISCWLRTHPRFSKADLAADIDAGKKAINVPWTLQEGKKIDRYYYLFDPEELESLARDVGFSIKQSNISNHNLFLTLTKV